MQEILVELTQYDRLIVLKFTLLNIDQNSILDRICSFVREKLGRNKAMRVIYSKADVGKIAEYRENLNSAMQKFEVRHKSG